MALVRDGQAIFVQFSDALVLCFEGEELLYWYKLISNDIGGKVQELVLLKYESDRFMGFGTSNRGQDLCILINSMVLSVRVGTHSAEEYGDESATVFLKRPALTSSKGLLVLIF